jgi:glycosyltransferase involved in cell wall biosynthesis
VTVSNFSKRRIVEEFKVPDSDILVTPIPPASPLSISEARQKELLVNLGIQGKYFLTLGTVEPRKNLPNMLDAFLRLPKELQSEYTFVVAGKIGWNCDLEVARLAEFKSKKVNIVHLGYVTDEQRSALYQHASLFTTASFYEGFGMPALEAMSYGTPCVMSNIPVFHEVAGGSALYFNPNEPASIADAWQQLLANPHLRQKLANDSKRQADSYNWQEVASNLYDHIATAANIAN